LPAVERLAGKVAIVTGGASGIGRAYAEGLAAAGASVLVADVLENEGLQTAQTIAARGGRGLFLRVDVSDVASTERMAAAAAETFGGVDILVNNAAVFAGLSSVPLTELPPDRWALVMDVNVKGVWLCMRAVVPYMRQRAGGAIVNQASIGAYGLQGVGRLDYGTSKAAVLGLTKNAAKELAADHIRVNAICPGAVASEAAIGLAGDMSVFDQVKESQLIAETINPDDMVEPLLFLVSDASKFMTGQALVVDGGRYFLG
jgi:NAD(P)-dependent dehydrogenase (short-subunit alcohol dehydrogenase family)